MDSATIKGVVERLGAKGLVVSRADPCTRRPWRRRLKRGARRWSLCRKRKPRCWSGYWRSWC